MGAIYEIETNRPFFCDRDGITKYALKEIGSERRNGYGWYGNWGDSLANMYPNGSIVVFAVLMVL